MSGNKIGGKKAAATNKSKYGENFYAVIGKAGGKNGTTGGFAAYLYCHGTCGLELILGPEHRVAQCAGYKGGVKSRRKKKEAV